MKPKSPSKTTWIGDTNDYADEASGILESTRRHGHRVMCPWVFGLAGLMIGVIYGLGICTGLWLAHWK